MIIEKGLRNYYRGGAIVGYTSEGDDIDITDHVFSLEAERDQLVRRSEAKYADRAEWWEAKYDEQSTMLDNYIQRLHKVEAERDALLCYIAEWDLADCTDDVLASVLDLAAKGIYLSPANWEKRK